MTFAETLQRLRKKSKKSRYRLSQLCTLDEAYLLRLESGQRRNPSREVVLMIAFALAEGNDPISIWDVDELLLSAGYAPLIRRGQGQMGAAPGAALRLALAGGGAPFCCRFRLKPALG